MSHLAARAGTAAFLLFGVFIGGILSSGCWAVIQGGRTLFLSPEWEAAISLGASGLAFLTRDSKAHFLLAPGTVGLLVLEWESSFDSYKEQSPVNSNMLTGGPAGEQGLREVWQGSPRLHNSGPNRNASC